MRAVISRPPCDAGPGARGFTLTELIAVVAVSAILVGLGVTGMRSFLVGQRIKTASFDLFSTLTFARSEAITRNVAVTVAPAGGNWANGWTVAEAGGTVLRRQEAVASVTISGPASVTYNAMGRLSAAVTSFDLSAPEASSSNLRCISVDLSGRPVAKSEACS